MKKLLCLLLALVMVLSLAACSDSDDKKDDDKDDEDIVDDKDKNDDKEEEPAKTLAEKLVGTWVIYVYMTEENTGLEGFETDAGLPIAFTFNEDGTYLQVPYEAEIDDAIAELEQDLCDYMVDLMYSMLETEGYTKEQVDEVFETAYGMSVQAYAQTQVEDMDMGSLAEERSEGTYELEDDQLFMDGRDETLTIAIEGDTLSILDSDDADSWKALFGEFPIEMERVD